LYDLISETLLKQEVPVHCVFETNSLDNEYELKKQFYKVNASDWDNAGFFDKELFIHWLIHKLMNEDFILPNYPIQCLIDDYDAISSEKFWVDGKLRISVRGSAGRYLQEQFYPFVDVMTMGTRGWSYEKFWKKPVLMYRAIKKLANKGRGLDRISVVRSINTYSRNTGPVFRHPGFYCALFEKLKLQYKHIHDLYPRTWARAIAATKNSMHYTYSDEKLDVSSKMYGMFVEEHLNGISNIERVSLEDVKCDVLICDGNFEIKDSREPYLDRLGKQWDMILSVTDSPEGEYIEVELPSIKRERVYVQINRK